MTSALRRVASTAVVALLLVSAVIGGFSAPVAAADSGSECSTLDGFIYDILAFQPFDENADNPCSTQYQVDKAVTEMANAEDNQTELDIYSALSTQRAQYEGNNVVTANYLNDSRHVAWSKGEVAFAEAIENGSSQAEAEAAMKQAINDYYSRMETNYLENVESLHIAYNYAENRSESEGLGSDFVTIDDGINDPTTAPIDYRNVSYNLFNGSTHQVKYYHWQRPTDDQMRPIGPLAPNGTNAEHDPTSRKARMYVSSPSTTSDPELTVYMAGDDTLTRMDSQRSDLNSEVGVWASTTYTALESGEINTSDVVSRTTVMFEYGTSSFGDNSSFYDSVGALAMMGLETPDLNESGTMEVVYDSTVWNGMLLARNAPNGSWRTGVTYNTSEIEGPVMLATTNGEIRTLSGEFSINTLTTKSGESVDSVETTRYNYQTVNNTELNEKMSRLLEAQQEIEEYQASIGGGGTGGGGGLEQAEMILLGAVAALAAIVLIRN